MAKSVEPADIDTFIDNATWTIYSTYHTVLNASPGAAIFGRDMLFNVLFIADWKQIGENRQRMTDRNNDNKNKKRVDYNYKVGNKILILKDGIPQSRVHMEKNEPWTIPTAHTNGTIRIQCRTKLERIIIPRVTPFIEQLI